MQRSLYGRVDTIQIEQFTPHRQANMVLMDPLLSSVGSSNCLHVESPTHASTKRRRESNSGKEFVDLQDGATRPRGRPRIASKSALSTTHELRQLRAQVASMEQTLHSLQSKWSTQLPDERMLTAARYSASKKREATVAEATNERLQEVLLQQQLLFAALQTSISRAPIHSSGADMFKSLHLNTRLGCDPVERSRALSAHRERSLATVPSTMMRFTQLALEKVLARRSQGKGAHASQSVLPISQIDITGGENYTLVTSVFMSEIPHTSLDDVYAAALAYYDNISATLKRHSGIILTRTRLNAAHASASYWRYQLRGVGMPVNVNHILCSDLTRTHGMIHMDVVEDDPLYPVSRISPLEYAVACLTLTPRIDPLANETVAVTFRWVVIYRYKLLADDPALIEDLEKVRTILNGDLITASICTYLHELHQRQSPRT